MFEAFLPFSVLYVICMTGIPLFAYYTKRAKFLFSVNCFCSIRILERTHRRSGIQKTLDADKDKIPSKRTFQMTQHKGWMK